MLYNILLIVQIVVSVAIIALILMQHGKGADAGAAFGSGASGTVFGSGGAGNFLSRTTAILATVFFLNCIALAWLVANRTSAPTSIMEAVGSEPAAPVAPAAVSEVPAAPGSGAAAAPVAADVPPAAPAVQQEVPVAPVVQPPVEPAAAPAAQETAPATAPKPQ